MFTDIVKPYCAIDNRHGTDKTTSHSYGDLYNIIFDQKKEAERILEIGIYSGLALEVYAKCCPNAQIYGIDIKDNTYPRIKKNLRIHLQFGDATDRNVVEKYEGLEFDLIIEDASHLPSHQVQHFKDFNKFVKKGGYYLIEDIDGKYFEYVKTETERIGKENGFTMFIHDYRNKKGRFDDIILLFRKD